ncbi:MAG: dihydropteroate synthase [Candidatus Azobacteroides sp.]|nr:dihydropteroate synthase [Candidatus Azobacteroides sp.]
MSFTINLKGCLRDLSTPMVMGILNVTPDSFYEKSRQETEADIIIRTKQMLDEGASVIDVGAYSSRPDAAHISQEEEWSRLDNALDVIFTRFPDIIVSVDTFRTEIARKSVEQYGVAIINDISGGEIDKAMFETVAELNVPYILMHMKGNPQTMVHQTEYKNFIQEVFYYFSEKIDHLHRLGVNDIIVDPGFGFAKNLDQNYELLKHLPDFKILNLPLLVGISRKRMIYRLLDTSIEDSLNGTTVINTIALMSGAHILRVHDVKAAMEAVKIVEKMRSSL